MQAAATSLGGIHGHIGVHQKVGRIAGIKWSAGDPNADTDLRGGVADHEGRRDGFVDARTHYVDLVPVDYVWEHGNELIAGKAREHDVRRRAVMQFAKRGGVGIKGLARAQQALLDNTQRRLSEQFVARFMPKAVIDSLEPIEIEKKYGEWYGSAWRIHGALQGMLDHRPIGKPCHRVIVGKHVHAHDVGIQLAHHGAEALCQSAHFAGAINLDRAIEVAGDQRLSAALKRVDPARRTPASRYVTPPE